MLFLLFLFSYTTAQNQFYSVPGYFGSQYLRQYSSKSWFNDDPSPIYWGTNFHIDLEYKQFSFLEGISGSLIHINMLFLTSAI